MKLRKVLDSLFIALAVFTFSALSLGGRAYAACPDFKDKTLLGLPVWYKYLDGEMVTNIDPGNPGLDSDGNAVGKEVCQPKITSEDGKFPKKDIALIAAAVLEMLIRLAGLAAFAYLLYGGFMYLTSSGNSESVKNAGSTLLNAAIGLAIAISAITLINFFANRLSQ